MSSAFENTLVKFLRLNMLCMQFIATDEDLNCQTLSVFGSPLT